MNGLRVFMTAPTTISPGPSISWATIVGSAVVAAIVGATVNLWLARRKSRDEERARVRSTCAEAFEAVAAYKEMPFAIRRREQSRAGDERIRLSSEMRATQARLSYYTAWMTGESEELGKIYDVLVTEVRRVVGGACHDAWRESGLSSDVQMNVPPNTVDLGALSAFESEYINAVRTHLNRLLRIRVRR